MYDKKLSEQHNKNFHSMILSIDCLYFDEVKKKIREKIKNIIFARI